MQFTPERAGGDRRAAPLEHVGFQARYGIAARISPAVPFRIGNWVGAGERSDDRIAA